MPSTRRGGDLLADVFSIFPDGGRDQNISTFERFLEQHSTGPPSWGIHLLPDGRMVEASQFDYAASEVGAFITDEKIGEIFSSRYQAALTETERRVLRGLVTGVSLRDISAADGISYATRRNQLKSVMEKSSTTRQSELVVTMSTLLVLSATQVEADARRAQSQIRDYVDRFYPKQARVYSPRFADGHSMLVLDLGPSDGMPVLHMHSAFFPVFPFPQDLELLNTLNLRIITPMRPGFFGLPVDWTQSAEARIEGFTAALASFLEDFDLADIPVFSHSHGIISTVSLCGRLGNRVPRLIVHGAQHLAPRKVLRQPVHIRGQMKILEKSPRLMLEFYRLLARALTRPAKLKDTLAKIFGGSRPDMAALSDPIRQVWLFQIISKVGGGNIAGIVSDLQAQSIDWLSTILKLPMPITLIYGCEDSYANHVDVENKVKGSQIDLLLKDDHGLISMMFEPGAILADIAEHHPRLARGHPENGVDHVDRP